MENTRTILVPVDFSPAALAAFETALLVHAQPGTSVVVLHVIDSEAVAFTVELGYGMPDDVTAKARTHAERSMRRLTDIDLPEGIDVQRVVTVGRPVEEILKLASDLMADLIIIGTHPTEIYGETPERVLRTAGCPVLVIPGPSGDLPVAESLGDAPSGAPSAN